MFGIAVQKIQNERMIFEDIRFRNLDEMEKFHLGTIDPCHYEIISGNQCLYFDFDGKTKLEFDSLVKAIVNNVGSEVKILLYDSCSKIKFSYHVIVRGIYLENHIACGILANKIISECNDEIKSAFDSSVYTSRRNLRMIGSRKLDSLRIKKFNSILFDQSDVFPCVRFSESLVCNVSDGKLFHVVNDIIEKEFEKTCWTKEDIDMSKKYIDENYKDIFSLHEQGNFLILRREKPAFCEICNHKHDSDNAYIFKREKILYFVCRRKNDVKIPIQEQEETIYEVQIAPPKKVVNTTAKEKTLSVVSKLFHF